MLKRSKKLKKQVFAFVLACLLVVQGAPGLFVSASDSLPWKDSAKQGENEPTVRGYTAQQIIDWSPEQQPYAELLRSHVPLQTRIASFAATQANPSLSADVQMFSVMGDYGNSFVDNPAYTNKFGVYTFNFWQYLDYLSYWHGTATAYVDSALYDPTLEWTQRWFEIGCLNIPNPSWTDAAHKNGVLSLGQIFFSDNDRGMLTYKQMLVQDAEGNFPVADKLIEMAEYYGYDGYFFNQEETGARNGNAARLNVEPGDFPGYRKFMAQLVSAGLYINWYDAVGSSGSNSFAKTINNGNVDWLYNRETGEQVSNSFFFDYQTSVSGTVNLQSYLDTINTENGTDFTTYEVGFSGIEAGRDKFSAAQKRYISPQLTGPNGQPYASIAMLGADFVHHELDSDLNHSDNGLAENAYRYDNEYQWMSSVRERFWWTGPNIDPVNAVSPAAQSGLGKAVGANETNWPGVSAFITERSVLGDSNFYTNFNTGRGLRWYQNGKVSNDAEWSNISIQDIPVTWQWWQDTAGSRLTVDYDFGEGYGIGAAQVADSSISQQFYDYTQVGGYTGGSSLVANGTLDAENFLRLYKTELPLNADHEVELYYHKTSKTDSSTISLGVIFQDAPDQVVKIPLAFGSKTANWKKATADMGDYAGKTIAAFGLVFDPGKSGSIENWQVNIGSLRISDNSAAALSAPTGLKIKESYAGTDEMVLQWDMEEDYSKVKQYNVYVNDAFVGAKYDGQYYIKNMPAQSGTIRVTAIGADGREGPAATISFDLKGAGVSGLSAQSKDNGELAVSWTGTGAAGNVTVEVETKWHLMGDAVKESQVVSADSGNAVFTGMPVNGDNYTVRLYKDGQDTLSVSGAFTDIVCAPYEGAYSWNGNNLYLPMPTTRDWRYVHFYEDGVEREFEVTYLWTNRLGIIRGRSSKKCLNFTSTAKTVWVTMEDDSGNLSEPVYLRIAAVDESVFPDAVLRQWVLENVGGDLQKVKEYTGALLLSEMDIGDFTGLALFENAVSLSVSGNQNIKSLSELHLPDKISALDISKTGIQEIDSKGINQYPALKELTISAMEKLALLSLSGTGISSLTVGDPAAFPALSYADLRNTQLDVSEGSVLRAFAEYIQEHSVVRGNVYETVEEKSNLSTDSAVTPSEAAAITDGNTATYFAFNEGSQWILDFKNPVTMYSMNVTMSSGTYSFTSGTLSVSDDGEVWDEIGAITHSGAVSYTYEFPENRKARYLKMTIDKTRYGSNYAARISEVVVAGGIDLAYPSAVYYDGQPEADTVTLTALVKQAQKYKEADYTPVTYQALRAALEAAETALAYTDPQITRKEAEICIAALQQALDNIMYSGSSQVLKDYVNSIWSVYQDSETEYTKESWENLKNAAEAALALAEEKGEAITREEYDAAILSVQNARQELVTQNTGFLVQWLDIAKGLLEDAKQGNYLTVSVENLGGIVASAEAVLANTGATQEEIDTAVRRLQDGVAQMLEAGNRRNLSLLAALAEELKEGDYTAVSWQEFSNALTEAKELLAREEATQEEYDASYETLLNAITGLVQQAKKKDLQLAVAIAEQILAQADKYVPATISDLAAITEEARTILADENTAQETVNAICTKLTQETAKARYKADKLQLLTLIALASEIDQTQYVQEGTLKLQAVLEAAQAIAADEAATQDTVDTAAAEVKTSIQSLVKKEEDSKEPEAPSKSLLNRDTGIVYINGYDNGTVLPGASIRRAEVAQIFYNLLTEESRKTYETTENSFSDVSKSHWANTAISTLANCGILKGDTAGSFRPNAVMSRAELVVMLTRFYDMNATDLPENKFSDVQGHWAINEIRFAANENWINGYPDGRFKPNQSISRAEAVKIVNLVLGRNKADLHKIQNMKTFTDNKNTEQWYYADIQVAANAY